MPDPRLDVITLDTSVLINLLATGLLGEILMAVAERRIVTAEVYREACVDPREKSRVRRPGLIDPWIGSGLVSCETLSGEALALFVEIVGAGPPDDIGDGEAGTIAWAATFGAVAVLDDAKATGVCRRRFPAVPVLTTVDLLRRVVGRRGLPEARLHEAVFDALRFARMRVPVEHDAWVRQVVGPERIPLCTSLRRRF